jgi:hypothetical protein
VWHYTNLPALVSMLRDRQLRLTRVDKFTDPFEGSIPKKQYEDQAPIFAAAQAQALDMHVPPVLTHHLPRMESQRRARRDPWSRLAAWRRAMKESSHASCWCLGEESEGMWRLYCADVARGQGVALCTAAGRLAESLESNGVVFGRVRYRRYNDDSPAFDDEMDPFFHKRLGFEHEREARLLTFASDYYRSLQSFLEGEAESKPEELPQFQFLAWDPGKVCESVIISPYASPEYEQAVKTVVSLLDRDLADRVQLSELSERRFAPLF